MAEVLALGQSNDVEKWIGHTALLASSGCRWGDCSMSGETEGRKGLGTEGEPGSNRLGKLGGAGEHSGLAGAS